MTDELTGKTLVLVMPCYNDWTSVEHMTPEIDKVFASVNVNVEILIVDDCSNEEPNTDQIFLKTSFSAIIKIECIKLTRNLGSQKSIAIGVAYAAEHKKAGYLIVADSDQQDKPEDMLRLLRACNADKNKNRGCPR